MAFTFKAFFWVWLASIAGGFVIWLMTTTEHVAHPYLWAWITFWASQFAMIAIFQADQAVRELKAIRVALEAQHPNQNSN
jgi:hypothetical protein